MDESQLHKTVPAPKGWETELWNSFWNLANALSRQELSVIWLYSSAGRVSDQDFNRSLQDMQKFTKEEMLGIIDEIGPKIARNILGLYSTL
jgi:hypothetical protein